MLQTGRGVWWLAVGAAAGCALLSKYTALFFGPAILIWLVAVPKLRHWLISPWLYLGGLVALVLFAPVILWNAEHHWVSFIKQMGRARIEDFRPVFIAELIPTQIAFATPLVWMLGAMGLYALFRRRAGALPARVLVNTMFWVIVAYFVWHSLHARVEANWFAPVYPAFAIAAAVAAHLVEWEPRWQRLVDFCRRWAVPGGVLMFVLLVVQADTGALSGYRRDATVRSVGVGWRETADAIEAVRSNTGYCTYSSSSTCGRSPTASRSKRPTPSASSPPTWPTSGQPGHAASSSPDPLDRPPAIRGIFVFKAASLEEAREYANRIPRWSSIAIP